MFKPGDATVGNRSGRKGTVSLTKMARRLAPGALDVLGGIATDTSVPADVRQRAAAVVVAVAVNDQTLMAGVLSADSVRDF